MPADEPGLVGDPVGVGVEPAAGDAEEAPAVDLADVDRRGSAGGEDGDRGRRTRSGMPSTRARSLPRPPGNDAERRLGPGERAADLADQAVAADDDRGLPGLGGREAPRDAVIEALGDTRSELDPGPRSSRSISGQQPRAPARRRRTG